MCFSSSFLSCKLLCVRSHCVSPFFIVVSRELMWYYSVSTASPQEACDIHLSSISVPVLVFLGPQVFEFLKAYPKPCAHAMCNVQVVIKVPG